MSPTRLGELGLFYRLAPIVFVGGSLVERGDQDPIEPIKLGAPLLHGPLVFNFTDVYGRARRCTRRGAEIEDRRRAGDADRLTG